MKNLKNYLQINEVSAALARKAANRQRKLLDDDAYLDGKTAAQYKKLLKRAEKFDQYADEKEAAEAKKRFLRMTSGDLIYDQNKIQVKIYGDFKYDVDYKCYNEDYEYETFNKSGSFGLSDIYNEAPSDEEVKSELGEEYSLSEDEWLYCANIEYPTIKIYYNYDSNPIIVINDLELNDAWADAGPGGDSYYRHSSWGRDFFSGELSWGDIDIDEDTYDLRKTLKDPIGDALAAVINYPMAFDYVWNGDRSFSKIDGDELLDACLEEE